MRWQEPKPQFKKNCPCQWCRLEAGTELDEWIHDTAIKVRRLTAFVKILSAVAALGMAVAVWL